jgi:hypothetical protein
VSTLAGGSGARGNDNGGLSYATFDHPYAVEVAPDGIVYVKPR